MLWDTVYGFLLLLSHNLETHPAPFSCSNSTGFQTLSYPPSMQTQKVQAFLPFRYLMSCSKTASKLIFTQCTQLRLWKVICPTWVLLFVHTQETRIWSSNTLATWCEEWTHWKRPWCWDRLRAGGEAGNRGWDSWMVSRTRWTWVWANYGRWWRTEKPGVLQSVGSQRVRKLSNWATATFIWTFDEFPSSWLLHNLVFHHEAFSYISDHFSPLLKSFL